MLTRKQITTIKFCITEQLEMYKLNKRNDKEIYNYCKKFNAHLVNIKPLSHYAKDGHRYNGWLVLIDDKVHELIPEHYNSYNEILYPTIEDNDTLLTDEPLNLF